MTKSRQQSPTTLMCSLFSISSYTKVATNTVGYCNADQHGNDYDISNPSQTNRDVQLPTKQKVDSSERDLIKTKDHPIYWIAFRSTYLLLKYQQNYITLSY